MAKKAVTYSIDEDIVKDFKIETISNDVEMSETISNFMVDYVKISRELKNQKNK